MVGEVLKAVLPDRPLPILSGPLRGVRWNPQTARLNCWLGTYEAAVQQAALSVLRPGDTVYDIGAFAGFFTLLAARRVGPTGRVHAVEPNAENRAILRAHLTANPRLTDRVTVHPVAIGGTASTGAITRDGEHSHLTGGAGTRVLPLDALPDTPRLIKLDVEALELEILRGAPRLLQAHPVWLIETHAGAIRLACTALLVQHGYTVSRVTPHHLFAHTAL